MSILHWLISENSQKFKKKKNSGVHEAKVDRNGGSAEGRWLGLDRLSRQ